MSIYALQKTIREINRNHEMRQRFMAVPQDALADFDLTSEERDALIGRDYRALYRLGVHGLILRPFSIINGVSEADYLSAICEEP
ncbi:MAG TPA: hypothetical protein VGB93_11165 [Methylovirgula sp.]